MTQEKLIARYEKQLEKVIAAWGNSANANDGSIRDGEQYILAAEADLEAVKNGRNW